MAGFEKILIANRGVCACRIMKTCKNMGINYATIFTEDDYQSLHVTQSVEKHIVSSYMDIDEIISLAKKNTCKAIHPGYGFQSENPAFPQKCAQAGIMFVGPTAENMLLFSGKIVAKQVGKENDADFPTLPSSDIITTVDDALSWVEVIGYPIMFKPVHGGGGIGMELIENKEQLTKKLPACRKLCTKIFGNGDLYMEKFILKARHIEVQVFGDGRGNVIHLGVRECSIQRRYQKLIEESPSPVLTEEQRAQVCEIAVRLCKSVKYKSVGTVEFIFDDVQEKFYFLEVNTRLQVEHRVTELRYGIDLVEWMIRLAFEKMTIDLTEWSVQPQGHVIECRVIAEDPFKNFAPTTGVITKVVLPDNNESRKFVLDTWIYRGCVISATYDSLLANVIQWAPTREQTIQAMLDTLNATTIDGPPNNLGYFKDVLKTDLFVKGETYTNSIATFTYKPSCVEVISPGFLTSVQDWPGRQGKGLWRIGVPPSGPMDHLACRVANSVVKNEETDAVLEITQFGPVLKFHVSTVIAITGAAMEVTLDDKPINMWQRVPVNAGSILKIGNLSSHLGSRAYLAVAGGFNVPEYLGSRATFPDGNLGGYQGRFLKVGDIIPVGELNQMKEPGRRLDDNHNEKVFDPVCITKEYSTSWFIGVLPGPHANPDYLTDEDMDMFYNTQWLVHQNSNRLGIRLCGPAPKWARADGGEGGSHPSNIHDCEYAVGTINFTGNMPIIIGQDGPSLNGFVCPCTIVQSELWKIGQLKAGDTITFYKMTIEEAIKSRREQNVFIRTLQWPSKQVDDCTSYPKTTAVLRAIPKSETRPRLEIRLAGDNYILIEYGPMTLDLNLRFRIHFLEENLLNSNIHGLEETAPGVRSLQLRYNPLILPLSTLLDIVKKADDELQDIRCRSIPSRILYLPMCFNYSGINDTIEKYMKSVRSQAPYLPSNIEYIFKNNGLTGIDDVKDRVFSASYMCIGLGDVYLGACCAVPVNPLHRLITSKYNPARTYTQEGTVGLGGSYMCIYPMNSPGGYQLIGRTIPIWDTFGKSNPTLFSEEKPWLLRMFDQIRFFPVSEQELNTMRSKFKCGALDLQTSEQVFSIAEYNRLVNDTSDEIQSYRKKQREAVDEILEEDKKSLKLLEKDNECNKELTELNCAHQPLTKVPEGSVGVCSPVSGRIWEITVSQDESVSKCQPVVSVEAMKMECWSYSSVHGVVTHINVAEGQLIHQGDLIMIIKTKNVEEEMK